MLKMKHYYNRVVDISTMLLVLIMVFSTFTQVIARFVFSSPYSWTEELARYSLVWATFLGATIAVRTSGHLGVDYFVNLFPVSLKKMLAFGVNIVIIVILSIIFWQGIELAQSVQNQLSPALEISMGYIYLAIPVGCLLIIIEYIWNTYFQVVKGGKS